MGKIKLLLILLLFFGSYKVYELINSFKIKTSNKIIAYKDKAGIERTGNVIALLMFKGNQVKLIENYPLKTATQCINQRNYARKKLLIKYQCAVVDASIISGKIIKVLKVHKILK
jgi:hypothetical protein|tara:strand:- start:1911 stop:2255 length:345 start_codon:yes stop_codon:yes gene_type:complete